MTIQNEALAEPLLPWRLSALLKSRLWSSLAWSF